MNIALIMAGGIGSRTGHETPKQFIEICGMPVIAHTMRAFQTHPDIDAICVVCVDGWHEKLSEIAHTHGITKLKHIVSGGNSAQESIFRGLAELHSHFPNNATVIQHDGVRPLVSHELISDCIRVTHEHGNAIACIPCPEAMLVTDDEQTSTRDIPRDTLRRTQTPNGYKLGDIWAAHNRANEMGLPPFVATCNLLLAMGHTLHLSAGDERNIKITTAADFDIVRALITIQQ